MKYKLLKEYPWKKIWDLLVSTDSSWLEFNFEGTLGTFWKWFLDLHPDFFEPIVEKKTYNDLCLHDDIFMIERTWKIIETQCRVFDCRSETFLTREESEDEHKRREWVVRKDKFYPKEAQRYFMPIEGWDIDTDVHSWYAHNIHIINLWLAFRTREDCQDAIDNHDLIRLFYNIR